jgi:hypothetical protein
LNDIISEYERRTGKTIKVTYLPTEVVYSYDYFEDASISTILEFILYHALRPLKLSMLDYPTTPPDDFTLQLHPCLVLGESKHAQSATSL